MYLHYSKLCSTFFKYDISFRPFNFNDKALIVNNKMKNVDLVSFSLMFALCNLCIVIKIAYFIQISKTLNEHAEWCYYHKVG